ncbi:hypothetical protein [Streptomyces bottropensis]|uniref:hypothetical protein n=1 Tax=Streptomyces bottropensis TaxID=42235 RepID=UPI0036C89ACC
MSEGLRSAWVWARAWAGVHATRPAAVLLATSGVLSLVGARAMIDNLGFLLFETPVSLLLLVPVIAGIAVGIGSDNMSRVPLPEPPRLATARAGWLLALTLTGAFVVSVGQLVGPAITWQAGVRNLLLFAALSVLTVSLTDSAMAWLPPVALTLASMLFGYPPSEPGYYWWAFVVEGTVAPWHWACRRRALSWCGTGVHDPADGGPPHWPPRKWVAPAHTIRERVKSWNKPSGP